MFDLLLTPTPAPTGSAPADATVTWADSLEAWATLGGAIVALAAAIATIWLLIHQIGETRRARSEAHQERVDAAEDRELARQDRELVAAERREALKSQARTVVIGQVLVIVRKVGDVFTVQSVQVPVENFGNQPVLDLRVVLDNKAVQIPRLPLVIAETSALGPGRPLNVSHAVDLVSPWGATVSEATANVEIWIAFTDASGLQWTRRMTAQPEQALGAPDAP